PLPPTARRPTPAVWCSCPTRSRSPCRPSTRAPATRSGSSPWSLRRRHLRRSSATRCTRATAPMSTASAASGASRRRPDRLFAVLALDNGLTARYPAQERRWSEQSLQFDHVEPTAELAADLLLDAD